jgi:putative copper export protein
LAVLQVGSIRGLIGATYGLILLAKLGLVAARLALAAINKLRLTPSLVRGEPGAAMVLQVVGVL